MNDITNVKRDLRVAFTCHVDLEVRDPEEGFKILEEFDKISGGL